MRAPLSVIVPTLNSASDLPRLSAGLFEGVRSSLVRELLIADCGSSDETAEISDRLGARIITTSKGRGNQLAAGARAAGGDWFLFLHADTFLAEGWAREVEHHIRSSPDKAAYFRLRFSSGGFFAAWVSGWANVRSAAFGLPYGDQGLLISRKLYNETGGYREIELFEDVEIARALRGRLQALHGYAISDPRRYTEEGWLIRGSLNLATFTRYLIGASPDRLARQYYRRNEDRQGCNQGTD